MTKAQRLMLLGEWQKVRALLRAQGVPPALADAQRHELTRTALGRDQSWSEAALAEWSQADVDRVKAALLSLSRPASLDAQLAQLSQPVRRARWRIGRLLAELGRPEAYAEAIARRMNHEGKLGAATLAELDEAGLQKVIVALTSQARRARAKAQEGPF